MLRRRDVTAAGFWARGQALQSSLSIEMTLQALGSAIWSISTDTLARWMGFSAAVTFFTLLWGPAWLRVAPYGRWERALALQAVTIAVALPLRPATTCCHSVVMQVLRSRLGLLHW